MCFGDMVLKPTQDLGSIKDVGAPPPTLVRRMRRPWKVRTLLFGANSVGYTRILSGREAGGAVCDGAKTTWCLMQYNHRRREEAPYTL